MSQKRKRSRDHLKGGTLPGPGPAQEDEIEVEIDTSKPTATFQAHGPRTQTLSIALPGSIIGNAKSHDQKTFLCGTIARALAVFCVDEVVIYDDSPAQGGPSDAKKGPPAADTADEEPDRGDKYTGFTNPGHFLAHVLTYLETPPYLRKRLFPMHPNLRTAGTLPSLDMPSHVRGKEWCGGKYREGVTTTSSSSTTAAAAATTTTGDEGQVEVDIGLPEPYILEGVAVGSIEPNTRVTVQQVVPGETRVKAVSPTSPREQDGYYWGYNVRTCNSLSAVLTECPFDGGYDVSFGTSERGKPLAQLTATLQQLQRYRHALIIFGGVAGLEAAAANDPELVDRGITGRNICDLFDYWVNLVPGQGSRTIRTEEAVWLGLMGLRGLIEG